MTFDRYYPITDRRMSFDLDNPVDIVRFVARERYAFPGGYELILVTTDGGCLCSKCANTEYALVLRSTKDNTCDGWTVAGYMTSAYIEESTPCDHCGAEISGYAD